MAGPDRRRPRCGIFCSARLRSIFGIALSVALAGCSVGPSYTGPTFPFAATFAAKRSSVPVLLDNVAWWQGFRDPALNELIEAALADNLDLALASERVREAQALARTVPSPGAVTGSATAKVRGGRDRPDETGADASLGLSWLFDPYGGRAAQVRAAKARIEVADAERDAARLLVLSNVATAYIDLRFQQQSLRLRRAELGSRRRTLELVNRLKQGNAATRLDIVRAEALVSQTQSLIPGFEAAIRVQLNRIAVLAGRTPGRSEAALLDAGRGQPLAAMPSDIGIPADLLRNRPDIRINERLYYAAVADIGVETAELYPALSLGGLITVSAFGSTRGMDYFFGPTLRLPALPDGPQQAEVNVRESRARQALTGWQSSVLGAIEEVESALVQYAGSRNSVTSARRTVRLYNESVELTRALIAQGGATIRDLLDAEQSVATANILLSQNLRQQGRDFVALNVNLGSGNGHAAGQAGEQATRQVTE